MTQPKRDSFVTLGKINFQRILSMVSIVSWRSFYIKNLTQILVDPLKILNKIDKNKLNTNEIFSTYI